jgi:hypothetical protein
MARHLLATYSSLGVYISTITSTVGKVGIILDADTTTLQFGEHRSGRFRKGFEDMEHGAYHQRSHESRGDDPSQFVYPTPTDWFHNNGVTYNRADDS